MNYLRLIPTYRRCHDRLLNPTNLVVEIVIIDGRKGSQLFDFNELISITIRAEILASFKPLLISSQLLLLISRLRLLLQLGVTAFERVQSLRILRGNGFVIIAVFVEAVVLFAVRAVPTVSVAIRHDRVFVAEPTVDSDREARAQQAGEEGGRRHAPEQRRRKVLSHTPWAKIVFLCKLGDLITVCFHLESCYTIS